MSLYESQQSFLFMDSYSQATQKQTWTPTESNN